jgi:hypothetical protein
VEEIEESPKLEENTIQKNEQVVESQAQQVVSILESMETYQDQFMEKYLELDEEN